MRRFICLALVVAVLLSASVCFGDDTSFDVSSMGVSDLLNLKMRIDQALDKIYLCNGAHMIASGVYTVGEDIDPGFYYVGCYQVPGSGHNSRITHYLDSGGSSYKQLEVGMFIRYKLSEGEALSLEDGIFWIAKAPEKISLTD